MKFSCVGGIKARAGGREQTMHTLSQRWECLISRVEALAAEAGPVPGNGDGGLQHHHCCSFKKAVHRVIEKRHAIAHPSYDFASVVQEAIKARKLQEAIAATKS